MLSFKLKIIISGPKRVKLKRAVETGKGAKTFEGNPEFFGNKCDDENKHWGIGRKGVKGH